jgi:hypothetical protein
LNTYPFQSAIYKKSKQFYLEAMKPLDCVLRSDYPSDAAGFFEGGSTSFWIVRKKKPVLLRRKGPA